MWIWDFLHLLCRWIAGNFSYFILGHGYYHYIVLFARHNLSGLVADYLAFRHPAIDERLKWDLLGESAGG